MRNALISRLSLAGTALLLTIASLLAFVPQTAYAAGETFTVVNANTISASGEAYSDLGTVNFAHQTDGSFTFRHVYQGGASCVLSWKITGLTKQANNSYTGTIATEGDCATGQLSGTITIGNPSNVTLAGAAGAGGGPRAAEEDTLCDQPQSWKELNFWMCPLINGASDMVESLDAGILDLLLIRTEQIFNTNAGSDAATEAKEATSSAAYFTAWSAFRNLAYAIIIIIGLVMVASQVLGFEWFDAYTIRKMLPKLLLAVIFIAVSWRAMEFIFNASNAAATASQALIKAPFANMKADIGTQAGDLTLSALVGALLLVGAGVGLVALTFAGPGAIGALIVSGALVVLSAWIILITRNTIATLLIVASPVPIACNAFEPFKKVYTIWKTVTLTVLISVPAVAAFLQISHVAALVTYIGGGQTGALVAFIILVAAYGFIFTIIRKLDAVWGAMGNITSQATGRLRGRLNNYAGKSIQRRYNEGMNEQRNYRGIRGFAVGAGRRVRAAGQVGGSWRGAAYQTAHQKIIDQSASKAVEADGSYLSGQGGFDEAMALAQQPGMTRQRFVRGLMDTGMSRGDAQNTLASVESSFGAQIGSRTIQVAAAKALFASNTSHRPDDYTDANGNPQPDEAYIHMYEDAARQVIAGNLTETGAAALIGSNKARVDRQAGFSTRITNVQRAVRNLQGGRRAFDDVDAAGNLIPNASATTVEQLRNEALDGNEKGAILGARHESITQLAPALRRRIQAAQTQYSRTGSRDDWNRLTREAANLAGLYDQMGAISHDKANILAEGVMSQRIDPNNPNSLTVQQTIESIRADAANNEAFVEARREYGNAWQAFQQGQGGPGQQQPPGALPH